MGNKQGDQEKEYEKEEIQKKPRYSSQKTKTGFKMFCCYSGSSQYLNDDQFQVQQITSQETQESDGRKSVFQGLTKAEFFDKQAVEKSILRNDTKSIDLGQEMQKSIFYQTKPYESKYKQLLNKTNNEILGFDIEEQLAKLKKEGEKFPKDTKLYQNGALYTGNIINGLRAHWGQQQWTKQNIQYFGGWKDDEPFSFGRLIINDDIYQGQFFRSQFQGKGLFLTIKGDQYAGDWLFSQCHGWGMFTWADGSRYEGNFVEGYRTGWGRMWYANESTYYEGDFWRNTRQGFGLMEWSTGDCYEGFWYDGRMHGDGVLTLENGCKVAANWQHGKIGDIF